MNAYEKVLQANKELIDKLQAENAELKERIEELEAIIKANKQGD